LLYVLRNQVGTQAVRFGCGLAQCGACTVIIDGVTKRSCVTPLSTVASGAQVTTLEGLGQPDSPNGLQGIQKAFLENQAGQCAYCASGIMMGSYNWLRGRRAAGNTAIPTGDEVKDFLSGINQTPAFVYLCRCGSHMRIVKAIQQASQEM
jgi:aerobic-type carbon monoxide dehydrogenase small subunit (CoxS/CutS family)